MPWQQLSFEVSAELAEAVSDALMALGAVSVTYLDAKDQPIYEPAPGSMPLWQMITVMVLFEQDAALEGVTQFLDQHPHIQTYQINLLADQDWERAWMADFKPMQFGQQLWICPSWCEPPDPNAVTIQLDPGLAFGSGTHPTTAQCLEALAAMDLQHKTVLDYGCGSGILAIAAAKLGAKTVWAVDNDPQALLATKDNAAKNNIDFSSFYIEGSDTFKAEKVDIVVANILANPLIALSERLLSCCDEQIILSGILADQADSVQKAYQPAIRFSPIKQQDNWVCLTGVR